MDRCVSDYFIINFTLYIRNTSCNFSTLQAFNLRLTLTRLLRWLSYVNSKVTMFIETLPTHTHSTSDRNRHSAYILI